MEDTSRAALAEFIATFAYVFVGAGAVIANQNGHLDLTGVALAHGLVLAIMMSVTAHLSGGLVNPALAIGLWVTGRLGTVRAGTAIVAELLGAVGGALLLRFLLPATSFEPGGGGVLLHPDLPAGSGVLIEAAATFLLVFAVFGASVDDRGPYGIAGPTIGMVIAFDIMAFGPWTGAAANPARWLGPALASGTWDDWWVWILGPVAGAILAAIVYWSCFLRDKEPATP